MNTVFTSVNFDSTTEHTQARFDRGLNSNITLVGNRILKTAKPGCTEREYEMLTRARELGVSVPHVKQVDERTLSIQYLHCGHTLWDYMQHGKLTKSIIAKVKAALMTMWKAGIVHGDLHINNVLITTDTEEVYIIDMASSWDAKVLEDSFGPDDFSQDIKDGIAADKEAFRKSFNEALALTK